jgi:hypothetical protein
MIFNFRFMIAQFFFHDSPFQVCDSTVQVYHDSMIQLCPAFVTLVNDTL